MLIPIISDIILILLLILAIWTVIRISKAGQDQAAFTRFETRLEDYTKRIDLLEQRLGDLKLEQSEAASQLRERLTGAFSELREELRTLLTEHSRLFEQRQGEAIKTLNDTLQNGMTHVQKQMGETLSRKTDDLGKRMDTLTQKTDQRLQEISGQVEKRLTEGFEKTTATFADVVKRLALIDEAQKKITELSSNVVSLQEVLADKRSRGAFGEVQLNTLIRNIMPEGNYSLQYTLPNNKVADCVLFLPKPTGMVVIDSKFPLESYRQMTDVSQSGSDRKSAEKQFKQDVIKHIKDIAEKYIIEGTTSDGAVMFIPAEAVFAEIQAHHPEVVERANISRVWIVSPTTLWATLNTARAVLKDEATREQVHIIQEHLGYLAKDFGRFQTRMNNLAKHIKQANEDVTDVNTSARKISSRFEKIESVELDNVTPVSLPVDDKEKLS
jgi:DNA recombination protein RmuC